MEFSLPGVNPKSSGGFLGVRKRGEWVEKKRLLDRGRGCGEDSVCCRRVHRKLVVVGLLVGSRVLCPVFCYLH